MFFLNVPLKHFQDPQKGIVDLNCWYEYQEDYA